MFKILSILGMSFLMMSSADCVQILPASGYGCGTSNEQINRINQFNAQQEQLQINRENLRIQQQMLMETQQQNLRYNMNNGW